MSPKLSMALLFAFAFSALLAPFQCASEPRTTYNEDDPAEALYTLSERLEESGEESARDQTLRYLIERYPSSRFAERARLDLRGHGEASESPAGSPAESGP